MRVREYSFDVMGLVLLVGAILLMTGVIAFTPVSVGVLLLIAKMEATLVWDR